MLKGDLASAPLAAVLRELADGGATGCVHLADPAGELAKVWLRGGRVYAVLAPGSRPALGARLVSSGALAPEALAEAMDAQRNELQGWRLGELLVHLGYVDQPVVEAYVNEQVRDALAELLPWGSGTWRFRVNERTRDDVAAPVPVETLLADVSERRATWSSLLDLVRGPDAVPVLSAAGTADDELAIDADAWSLLCQVDGARTVTELARECGFTLYEAGRVVHGLVTAGLLEVEDPRPAVEVLDEEQDEPEPLPPSAVAARLVSALTGLGSVAEDGTSPDVARSTEARRLAPPPGEEDVAGSISRVSGALSELLGPAAAGDDVFCAPLHRPTTDPHTAADDPAAVARARREAARRERDAEELAAAQAQLEATRAAEQQRRAADLPEGHVADVVDLAVVRRAQEEEAAGEADRAEADNPEAERAEVDAERAEVEAEPQLEMSGPEAAVLGDLVRLDPADDLETAGQAGLSASSGVDPDTIGEVAPGAEDAHDSPDPGADQELVQASDVAEDAALEDATSGLGTAETEQGQPGKPVAAPAHLAEELDAAQLAEERHLAEQAEVEKVAEQARLTAEAEAARVAEDAERAWLVEQARLVAEAEAVRAAEEAENARIAEESRLAAASDAARAAENARIAEESRLAAEAESARRAEEVRRAADVESARQAEELRRAADVESARQAEEARRAAEADAARASAAAETARLAAETEAARAEARANRGADDSSWQAAGPVLVDRVASSPGVEPATPATPEVAPLDVRALAEAQAAAFAELSAAASLDIPTPVAEPAPAAVTEPHVDEQEPPPATYGRDTDTASLLRELSSLGLDDDGPSVPSGQPPRPPVTRPVSVPVQKKRKGLFGRG